MRAQGPAILFSVALGLAGLLARASAGPQAAEGPAGAERQRGMASQDPAAAQPGTYRLDPNHASVAARILHEGTSFSILRFHGVAGTLNWNPRVEASKVDITVDSKSVVTPDPGFITTLRTDRWFNAEKFPQIRFISTGIRQTGPTTGEIVGDLTLLGRTRPITISAELVGIGASMRGVPTIGFKGSTRFKRSDFGMTSLMGAVGDEVEMLIDVEFDRQG